MHYLHSIPAGAIACHYVEFDELKSCLKTGQRFCEYFDAPNYFFITDRPDAESIEGWIGRPDHTTLYFEKPYLNYSFFADYYAKRTTCFTFDKRSLYQVITIIPEKPLKFILKLVQDYHKLLNMLSQEEIYQYLQKKQWAPILHILYEQKNKIMSDVLLQQAARTFENEFLREVSSVPMQDSSVVDHLEKLYMLHAGKFFSLQQESLKLLTLQLAARKPGKEGYNYALHYPDDEDAKKIIHQFEANNNNMAVKGNSQMNLPLRTWIEIYNRLFEIINDNNNSETYFNGPRFITVIREFQPYFPDYTQYIDLRNKEGKSTSRKIYYYDVLIELPENIRMQVVERILQQLKRSEPIKTKAIEMLMGKELAEQTVIDNTKIEAVHPGTPVAFISYSWDSKEHEDWVLNLADRLCKNGVDVILDKYELRAGKNLIYFMEQSIKKAHKVIVVFTPNYKLKADNRKGGVGYEYSILNGALYNNQTANDKIIPVLRSGSMQDSIPEFMRQFIHLDLRNDENFATSFNDLLREIYDQPAVKKPALGNRPSFE